MDDVSLQEYALSIHRTNFLQIKEFKQHTTKSHKFSALFRCLVSVHVDYKVFQEISTFVCLAQYCVVLAVLNIFYCSRQVNPVCPSVNFISSIIKTDIFLFVSYVYMLLCNSS